MIKIVIRLEQLIQQDGQIMNVMQLSMSDFGCNITEG